MLSHFETGLVAALLALALAAPAQAFRSTNFQSFTDPDYQDFRPTRLLVTVVGDGGTRRLIEERVRAALEKRGITVFSEYELFVPTRKWSAEARDAVYAKQRIDAQLTITAGESAASVIPIMTQTYSSATATTGATGASAFGTSTSYPVFAAKSTAEFSGVLFDVRAHRVAWYVDVLTKAGGTLFVGAKGDAKGAVKGILGGLEHDGHIARH